MNANGLLDDESHRTVEELRYELLNADFTMRDNLPAEMGKGALVMYSDATAQSISVSRVEDVLVCHIHMMEGNCYKIVANPDTALLDFVERAAVQIEECPDAAEAVARETPVADEPARETPIPGETDRETSAAAPAARDMEEVASPDAPRRTAGPESVDDLAEPEPADGLAEPELADDLAEAPCVRIVLGTNLQAPEREIVFEPNNTNAVSHPNMGIIGTMGTGKTQLARSIIAQFARERAHNVGGRPIGMLVFDYKGDYYQRDFLDAVAGASYSNNFPFNPLKLIVTEKNQAMNLPAITADRISDSFAKAYNLGPVQQSAINQVIVETYRRFGITRDPQTWKAAPPTMQDVIDGYLAEHDARDSVFALFSKLSNFSTFATDNASCVSLFEWLDGVKVIDLTPFPDDTKKVIVSLILDLFYEEMRQLGPSRIEGIYRELRAMVLVDEAHQFLKKDFNSFRNIISEGRSFGVGMILSTQNVSDFKSAKEEYAQFILSWAIHHVNNISNAEIGSIFGSAVANPKSYVAFVSKAEKFQCLCKLGHDVYEMRDLPFFELIQK